MEETAFGGGEEEVERGGGRERGWKERETGKRIKKERKREEERAGNHSNKEVNERRGGEKIDGRYACA